MAPVPAPGVFEEAFRRVFLEHFPWLFRYLDRLTGDSALAADVAQDAFVRLYQRGGMPDDVRAWLAAVANNLVRDDRRTRTRRNRLLARRTPEHTIGDGPSPPDHAVTADETRYRVRQALDRLSDRDRRLLLLRHEGLSYRELATIMDIGETSIGTFLARARAAFRAAYSEEADAH